MARRGMYKSEKRRKELKRKKKQDEKLLKRQKKIADELLDGEAAPDTMEATDATDIQDETQVDGSEAEITDEEAVPAED